MDTRVKKEIIATLIDAGRADLARVVAGPFGRQAPKGNISLEIPAGVTKMAGEAYNQLVTLKLEMDAMEEVPNYLKPIYKATMQAIGEAGKLKGTAYNLQMNLRKAWRSVQ